MIRLIVLTSPALRVLNRLSADTRFCCASWLWRDLDGSLFGDLAGAGPGFDDVELIAGAGKLIQPGNDDRHARAGLPGSFLPWSFIRLRMRPYPETG